MRWNTTYEYLLFFVLGTGTYNTAEFTGTLLNQTIYTHENKYLPKPHNGWNGWYSHWTLGMQPIRKQAGNCAPQHSMDCM